MKATPTTYLSGRCLCFSFLDGRISFHHPSLNLILQIGEHIDGALVIQASGGMAQSPVSFRIIQFVKGFPHVPTVFLHQHLHQLGRETQRISETAANNTQKT